VVLGASSTVRAQHCAHWDPLFGVSGINEEVRGLAAAQQRSAIGPALFAGGRFTRAGDVDANYVARWDGRYWSPLGVGVNAVVNALAVYDEGDGPVLFAGGWLTEAGGGRADYIARWDGQAWSPVGSLSGTVFALHVFDDGQGEALYAGGNFNFADQAPAKKIAKWDGQRWWPMGSGMSTMVLAITDYDDGTGSALYAAGTFRTTGDGRTTLNRVAKWDGQSWQPLGDGMPNTVQALAVYDDGAGPELYAGGLFRKNQGAVSDRVAKWNGHQWLPVGSDLNGNVFALKVFDDGRGPALYAAGNFTRAQGKTARGFARWTNGMWKEVDRIEGLPMAMTVFNDGAGDGLYIGGDFTQTGNLPAEYIAHWGCTRCQRLKRLAARCNGASGRLTAVLRSRLLPGTELTLILDGSRPQTLVVGESGKGKVKWRKVYPGLHKVRVDRCPGKRTKTMCEP